MLAPIGVSDTHHFAALGLGVPPLPLWAHGEPAEMPAPHFFLAVLVMLSVNAGRGVERATGAAALVVET